MGNQLGAGLGCRNCDGCSATCAHDRCSSMCFTSRSHSTAIHNVTAECATDHSEGPPRPERYELPGETGGSPPICSCEPHEEAFEGDADRATYLDQVLPLADEPHGSDIPNIGARRSITALEEECRFNQGKVQKIRRLAEGYGHWRPIRGDGNCYYRTVVFGAIEALLAVRDFQRMEQLLGIFRQVRYERPEEQRAHLEMLRRLQTWNDLVEPERWVAQDEELDQALIRACRRLVRLFLVRHAERKTPSGLTYSELVRALDSAYTSVEEFCARVVDPMGRDAETLALDALPLQLGVGLRLWILDRRDDIDLVSLDTLGPDGNVDVHVLFKPGHYDLLYPRRTIAAIAPATRAVSMRV